MSTLDGLSESRDEAVSSESPVVIETQRLSRRQTIVDISTILAWVLASDLLIYHSGGYAAWAVFLAVAAGIILAAGRTFGAGLYTLLTLGLLVASSLRLAWCGGPGAVASGILLIIALSMSINGAPPFLPDMLRFVFHVIGGSSARLSRFSLRSASAALASPRARYGVLLPVIVVMAFSTLFVLANPDLYAWIHLEVGELFTKLGDWLKDFDPWQVVFWIGSAWLAMGFIYPAAGYLFQSRAMPISREQAPSDVYVAVRNMMISVVLLFAGYLVFEFMTLWFREFPKGFYYAGYAHEGAFWLTVALALATLVLSMTFRGSLLGDPRVKRLRFWAWLWSLENLLLGLAVFNRLFIYIDFNGMTRMRVIGLLGTLSVVIGFALVVAKIVQGRGFLWLIRGQLWTVTLAAVLYSILPVDYFVHEYNARQILAGKLAPSTQIPTHETSVEGLIPLVSLLNSDDATIRSGIEATLADWQANYRPAADWRHNQWSHRYLSELLQAHKARLQPYLDSRLHRLETMKTFYDYVYQWY